MKEEKTSPVKFAEAMLEPAEEIHLKMDIYREYVVYCLDRGLETYKVHDFANEMHRIGYFKTHRKPGKTPVFTGLRVKSS